MSQAQSHTQDGPDPIDIFVGQNVRLARKAAGITQDSLAQTVGLTFQQIQKYERGANRISASKLCRIAEVLGVAPASLLPEPSHPIRFDIHQLARLSDPHGLIADFVALPSHQQRAVRRLVKDLAGQAAEPMDNQAA